MRLALLAATLPALALAVPTPENDKKVDHYEDKKPEGTKWRDEYQDSHRGDKWEEHKPEPEHHDDGKDDDHHDDSWKGSFPFHFTSTAVAYADGNQIVNNSQVAVPGLEGGWGQFSFGLNSAEDVICHVSHFSLEALPRSISLTLDVEHHRLDPRTVPVTRRHCHAHSPGRQGRCRSPQDRFPQPGTLARSA